MRWPRLAGPAALGLGALHTAAFAPVEAWWLQILALAGLVALVARAASAGAGATRRAAALGVWFGLGWFASGLWWLFISMHHYGGLAAPLAAGAVGLLALFLALYPAAALAAWARWRRGRAGQDVALFAACWLLAELARASFFTGFPWIASGYAHSTGPLAAWAPWLGVYGILAIAAAASAALALAWRGPADGLADRPADRLAGAGVAAQPRAGAWSRWLPLLLVSGLAALGQGLPQAFTRSTGRLAVSLVQPNIAQDLKFDAARIDANLDALARAVEGARGTLVVTPESVVPLPLPAVPAEYWTRLAGAVAAPGRAALVGVFLGDEQAGYVNSMIGLGAAQAGRGVAGDDFYRYGKRHLLPFGEFIPPGFGWFVRAMAIPLDDQARGQSTAPMRLGAQRLRPLICYEDLFGEDLADSAVGPDSATVYVNASNLAWFGPRMVQDQHLQFSRMRALEFQRPVVRSTNTGATAVVDHHGRVSARLPPEVAATLEAEVDGRTGDTPYARWLAAAGLQPLWALALAVVGAMAWRPRRVPAAAGPGGGQ
ncbi:apolipoprotein N-acyltransferase [Aquabacterium sp. OR-4]|uniref:apolipoprotein N-acyltransferase n=1 Tax=Aquabacterium sp. OR-4 TaxID=2978127 RepID=UPI0021B312F2|nr:apolipoprotein N-acyltransferase [Aquabacterium sp. OR-4]MDT7834316.1 apolipoprotein N-acyltransferase [Aquabacterium sp. OR-4]